MFRWNMHIHRHGDVDFKLKLQQDIFPHLWFEPKLFPARILLNDLIKFFSLID